jgi:hypothetical protein
MRCTKFLRYFFSEFQISESEFRFGDFSTAELKKKPTRISGNENGIGILLPMGVPELGTKNWNSQPSTANTYVGTFLWSSNNTLSNHSPFSFLELEPI